MTRHTDPALVEQVDGLLSGLAAPPPLSPAQIARIRTRIDDQQPTANRRLAVAMVVVVMLGAVAIAMRMLQSEDPVLRAPVLVPELDGEPPAPIPTRIAVHDPAAITPERESEPAAPLARPTPTTSTVVKPAVEPEAREGTLGVESRLLATALRQLRHERDARAALATLNRYDEQFPTGVLAGEARTARIEVLLALGNKAEALVLLDAAPVKSDLAVARGELRLERGRIEEAARDFESALIGTNDDVEQRALFGRAACRIRLGDEAGAKRDLEEYLRRFPNGRSAVAARKVLERIP